MGRGFSPRAMLTYVTASATNNDDDDVTGVKIVVSGLNVEATSVYWVACRSVCRHAVLLKPLTDIDNFYVVSSLPFDGTGRHIIRHVLVVATDNGTSVRLVLPLSADGGSMLGGRHVNLDAFQTVAVERGDLDLTELSVEATKPVFVSVSLLSKQDVTSPSTVRLIHTGNMSSASNSADQNEQIYHDDLTTIEAYYPHLSSSLWSWKV